MIFNVHNHIQYIRNGLSKRFINTHGVPARIVKTQTRRRNRGVYQVGKDYAVQRKRGVKAEPGIRIVIDDIRAERPWFTPGIISTEDAWAEGGYTPKRFEETFKKLNPEWKWYQPRWVFEFHVIEVQKQ